MTLCTIGNETIAWDQEFVEKFEQKVKETIEEYKLINKEDKVIVAVSGGKDSTVLLYVLKKLGYEIEALTINVHIGCYTDKNLVNITNFCRQLNVKLHKQSFKEVYGHTTGHILKTLKEQGKELGSCTVCGVLRRKVLNDAAKLGGATKLATGHNLDDESQTILMNIIKNQMHKNARIGPIQTLKEEEFVHRIKPLYFTVEEDVAKYSKMHEFPVQYSQCPCSLGSTRTSMKIGVTLEQKKNIMKWFKKNQNKLQLKYKSVKKLRECAKCSGPCTGGVCRVCDILENVGSESIDDRSVKILPLARH